jgi:hypothetical protein
MAADPSTVRPAAWWTRRARYRERLFGLHVMAFVAGAVGALVWAVFRFGPAAVVGGVALGTAAVLALLAYPRTPARSLGAGAVRAAAALAYAAGLGAAGAIVMRLRSPP